MNETRRPVEAATGGGRGKAELSISICIVTFNNAETIEDCLQSAAAACEGMAAEIIVVDNASGDATRERVRACRAPARLLASPVNRGFGAGCNLAARESRGDWLLFLNPDCRPAPCSLAALVDYAAHRPEAGCVGCRIKGNDGRDQKSVRRFPDPRAALHAYTILGTFGLFGAAYRRYRQEDFDYERTAAVDTVMGAVMLLPRAAFEAAGGFDERFFMYYEDVDLCRCVWNAGKEVIYFAGAEVRHAGGHSAEPQQRLVHRERVVSLMRYLAKHGSAGFARRFRMCFLWLLAARLAMEIPLDALRALRYAVQGRPAKAAARWRRARAKACLLFWDLAWVAFAPLDGPGGKPPLSMRA